MIKRKLLEDIRKHLTKPEITLIVGPRQAGKTTIMKTLEEELKRSGEKTLYLNLDIEYDKEHFHSQLSLLRRIELEFGKNKGYVFIDEIQRKEDAGLFLKGIYDMNLPYKFIVSGSGSVELKERIHESLTGRKRVFELLTLSFEEFINYKTGYKYEEKLPEYFEIEKSKSFVLFDEYLNFGGYPRVVLEEELSEKLNLINEIYQSYIERDIYYLLKIQKLPEFSKLIKILADSAGKTINLSEISTTIGVSLKTLKDYLWYLEKTFIVSKITPFFRNLRKELSKSPVYYFYDIGLRNFSIGEFGKVRDYSFIFQNFVYLVLLEKVKDTAFQIHFWRTKDKAEIDFIIDTGVSLIPLEVKYKNLKNPEITRALRSFIERYSPPQALIVNLSLYEKSRINGTEVITIPFYKLIDYSFK
ncbi:ATP-binding protein [Thermodesulfovibrio yellowstonii]|uniref:ATP-binding protein n=1 Tax=Thermodesulfovibrio yellowstonii TaxID=28262 RepID=UPI0024B37CFD|nr:ATP-binding protein [Thermodesulfovibrio yellowstonii]MDI6865230.1 ATP-binding protein [Thermodesulfovibrio yellowstonii]